VRREAPAAQRAHCGGERDEDDLRGEALVLVLLQRAVHGQRDREHSPAEHMPPAAATAHGEHARRREPQAEGGSQGGDEEAKRDEVLRVDTSRLTRLRAERARVQRPDRGQQHAVGWHEVRSHGARQDARRSEQEPAGGPE